MFHCKQMRQRSKGLRDFLQGLEYFKKIKPDWNYSPDLPQNDFKRILEPRIDMFVQGA